VICMKPDHRKRLAHQLSPGGLSIFLGKGDRLLARSAAGIRLVPTVTAPCAGSTSKLPCPDQMPGIL
jgi:hypothetical protein